MRASTCPLTNGRPSGRCGMFTNIGNSTRPALNLSAPPRSERASYSARPTPITSHGTSGSMEPARTFRLYVWRSCGTNWGRWTPLVDELAPLAKSTGLPAGTPSRHGEPFPRRASRIVGMAMVTQNIVVDFDDP